MTTDADEPFVLAFLGYVDEAGADRAAAFEDAVLPLLEDHGAQVVYRGRRAAAESDAAVPAEVHLLWFPHRAALDGYLADPRRNAAIDEFGEVFTDKRTVRLDTLVGPGEIRP